MNSDHEPARPVDTEDDEPDESVPVLRVTKGRPWVIDRDKQRVWSTVTFLRKHAQPIVQLGDQVLRRKSINPKHSRPELEKLAAAMFASMFDVGGVGIAASQIGIPLRVALLNASGAGIFAVNPRILTRSIEEEKTGEGCLSVLGFQGKVRRPLAIKAEAFDIRGRKFEFEGFDLGAQVIAHELDHLDGILYIDRLDSMDDLFANGEEGEELPLADADRRRLSRAQEHS